MAGEVINFRTPMEDAQKLVDFLMPFVRRFLSRNGELAPFGGQLGTDGTIKVVMPGEDFNGIPSANVVEHLREYFSAAAKDGNLRASAIVYDAIVTLAGADRKTDAVVIELNHIDKYAVDLFNPYELIVGGVKFSDPVAKTGRNWVFP